MTNPACPRCRGTGWVCADHQLAAWDEGCTVDGCGAEGVACLCNPAVEMPPGTRVIASVVPAEGTISEH